MKENTKKANAKKIRYYTCGKEMSEYEVILSFIPSCCGWMKSWFARNVPRN